VSPAARRFRNKKKARQTGRALPALFAPQCHVVVVVSGPFPMVTTDNGMNVNGPSPSSKRSFYKRPHSINRVIKHETDGK
jgi:hypothetical protein